ncbi:MAG TPA: glycoside hydrolase family 1 protein [Anaerolineaceae bacterium]|nr:glycoside hydrolase family 1 protein [Anaerolineaceae bacterium]HPN49959.1 glycoside hydrolase family 1 protein [Anaerolineaceae bacterium]
MPQASFLFPKGFLWGTATAAHQVEGNNTNNSWWNWEQQPGRIVHGQKSGLACDWWGGRWQEDMDRAVETHQNAHRFSVEWSRIQPAPDRWDESALDMYREMLRGMHERGIEPMVTLHHFSDPMWLVEQGGWETEKVVPLFEAYTKKVVEALKEYVHLWVTINEPNVYTYGGYLNGGFPPGKNDFNLAMKVMINLARGHAVSYRAIHALQPDAQVGIALNYRSLVPAHAWSPLDKWAAQTQAQLYNNIFPGVIKTGRFDAIIKKMNMPEVAGTQDFLGINYYTRDQVVFHLLKPDQLFGKRYYREGVELSTTGFLANEPEGMIEALRWGASFKVPLMVTENGVEDSGDKLRPRYLIQHVHQMWRGVTNSFPIKGYFYWSLVDNFEWERGWTQRFGLWELEVETQVRRKRGTVDLYAQICQNNGLTHDMVSQFAPDLTPKLFPE